MNTTNSKPEPVMTGSEAIRHAVQAIIDADPPAHEIRRMVMSLIPAEHHGLTCTCQHCEHVRAAVSTAGAK